MFARKAIVVDPYALGWALIGAAGIGYEIAMVVDGHPERTLSAYVRRGLGLSPWQPWAPGGMAALSIGLVWLGVHLGLGILPSNGRATDREPVA
ncbi:hypothetical protein GTS_14540 [Gandjariella thermophila]|uniref:Uncharacterized protein n=1 Tax=Gandjariella thermophila TaxID=1931992 RepID=A0A4D4J002_9PSEU|nr:hypothetical protein GTS_14540 [Gandjariella thermophila]